MKSWRDDATPDAQVHLDGLLNIAIDLAKQQLDRRGGFTPFAVAATVAEEVEVIAPDDATDAEDPSAEAAAAGALEALRAKRSGLCAAAIVSDVRTGGSRGDAIEVFLEHVDGHALVVHLPYGKSRFGSGRRFGSVRADSAERRVWADP